MKNVKILIKEALNLNDLDKINKYLSDPDFPLTEKSLNWMFADACRDQNEELFNSLIKTNKININFENGLPFINCCRYGNDPEVVNKNLLAKKMLTFKTLDLRAKNSDCFYFSVKDRNLEMFTLLLEKDIDFRAREYSAIKEVLDQNLENYLNAILKSSQFFEFIDDDFFKSCELFKFKNIDRLKQKFFQRKIEAF